MIITCPNCATRYQVPDEAFTDAGRKVRCRTCRFTWHSTSQDPRPGQTMTQGGTQGADVESQAGSEAETGAPATDIESAARTGRHEKQRKAGYPAPGDWKGWLALAACLALIIGGLYEYRQSIVAVWPASARLYALIGLPVNALGIEFANLRVERDFDNGLPVLSVTGEVVNVSGRTLDVPRLRVGLRDRTQREIYRWTVAITSDPLKANARARFATRLAAPPREARAVFLRFESGARRKVGLLK